MTVGAFLVWSVMPTSLLASWVRHAASICAAVFLFRAYEIDGAGHRKLVKNVHCEMRIEGPPIAELGSDGQISALEIWTSSNMAGSS